MSMKQSPVGSRTKNSKGFKVKHVMQTFLLLLVSVWLIYQLKHSYDKKAALNEDLRGGLPLEEIEAEQEILLRLGRKDLIRPIVSGTETMDGNSAKGKIDEEIEEIDEEGTRGAGGSGGGDDELDRRDQERTEEEEPEEVKDLIDVEDRKRDERNEDGKDIGTETNVEDHTTILLLGGDDHDEVKEMG